MKNIADKGNSKSKSLPLHRQNETTDPVLLMLGVGRDLWKGESGDSFIERLRSEDEPPPPRLERILSSEATAESVWQQIRSHQGEKFRTATRLPFTYTVERAGIWFFREGRRINRKLTRNQVEQAIARCPLASTTEIKDLIDYPYLFALLMDPRIRRGDW
jgi:hypothetical protein